MRIEEAIKHQHMKSVQRCQKFVQLLDARLEKEINEKYPAKDQLKINREYWEWVGEGRPECDLRELKYNELQMFIKEIHNRYEPVRTKIRKIMESTFEHPAIDEAT